MELDKKIIIILKTLNSNINAFYRFFPSISRQFYYQRSVINQVDWLQAKKSENSIVLIRKHHEEISIFGANVIIN